MGRDAGPGVVVVGGGPAGCSTALACRQAGLDVLLLTRPDERPERPGEALHPGAESLLEQLGVAGPVRRAGFVRTTGHWVAWGGPRCFQPFGADPSGPWRGLQAWRPTFDALLCDEARRAGVDVVNVRRAAPLVEAGRVCGVAVDGRDHRAAVVVDATGAGHWLARRLGLAIDRRSPPLLAWYAYLAGDAPALGDDPVITADATGWTWLARVRDGLFQWVRLPFSSRRPEPGWRPAELAGLSETGPARGADVTWRHVPASAGPGYVLVGDAACVLDPLSAHGVLRALLSGMVAARVIADALAGQVHEAIAAARYRRWQAGWFESDVAALRALYGSLPQAPAWVTRQGPHPH